MALKIVLFAPNRVKPGLEILSAKVTVVTERDQLSALLDHRRVDLVLLLDTPAELRREIVAEARRAGRLPVVSVSDEKHLAAAQAAPASDPLDRARRFMDDNYRLPLTLEEIAAQAGISAGYFCRRFKSRYQVSPIEYLRTQRLSRATSLLLQTDLPLASVTDQSGFFSISYFCREFHKAKGLAPITFRRQNTNRRTI